MSKPMSAIGAVIYGQQLTVAVRRVDVIEEPQSFSVTSPIEATAFLLRARRDNAPIYIESGALAGQALKELKRRYADSPDEIVNGMAPALTAVENVEFANRRSELFFLLRQRIEEGKLFIPPVYNEELSAFAPREHNGEIFVDPPEDVAARLGKFPAFALAATLAAIEPPKTAVFTTASKRSENPLGGHDIFAFLKKP